MSDGTFLSRVAAWEMERSRLESRRSSAQAMRLSNEAGIALFREAQVALHEFALALQEAAQIIAELRGEA